MVLIVEDYYQYDSYYYHPYLYHCQNSYSHLYWYGAQMQLVHLVAVEAFDAALEVAAEANPDVRPRELQGRSPPSGPTPGPRCAPPCVQPLLPRRVCWYPQVHRWQRLLSMTSDGQALLPVRETCNGM